MNSSFVIYIDESGDEGFSFGKGSSEWFVLSAVITRKDSDLSTVKLVDNVRARLNKQPKTALHFRDLKHEQRLAYTDEISKAKVRIASVLIYKPLISEKENFQERHRLYFYTTRYLLERISWFCRDHKTRNDSGDGSTEIIFSNRAGMSYESLKEYFDHLKSQSKTDDIRIEWSVINSDQVTAVSPRKRMGLLIADAVASGFFYGVEKSQYGFNENRYACMLKSVVYNRRGQYSGYGLKLWPREVIQKIKEEEIYGWLRNDFGFE